MRESEGSVAIPLLLLPMHVVSPCGSCFTARVKRPVEKSLCWIAILVFSGVIVAQDVTVPNIPGSTPAVAVAPAPVKRVKIDPQFVLGQTYRYTANTELRAQLPDHGIRALSLEQQARFVVSPRADEKSGVRISGRTERLVVSLRSAGVTLEYDSFEAEDRKSKFGQYLQPGLRQGIDILVNRDNRVVAPEESLALPDDPKPKDTLPRFGPDELTELVSLLLQGASEKPVGPGQTWSLEGAREVSGAGQVSFDLTYRHLGSIEFEGHLCQKIGVSGSLSGLLPTEDAFSAEMRFEGGSLGGEIYYDPVLRTFRYIKQSISMLLEMPSEQPDAPLRQIAIEQSTTSRLLHRIATP